MRETAVTERLLSAVMAMLAASSIKSVVSRLGMLMIGIDDCTVARTFTLQIALSGSIEPSRVVLAEIIEATRLTDWLKNS